MRRSLFLSALALGLFICGPASAQPVKVLFFEAALAPADMSLSAEPSGYAKLAELLRGQGMLVASMSTGEISREKLSPYEIVVLHASPERPLLNREISALVWFVAQQGGTLFVHGGTPRIINPLTEIFGVSMANSNLIDPSSAMEDNQNGRKFVLTNFPANAGFQPEGIKKIGFYGGAPLLLSSDAAPVLLGDEDCYSDNGLYSIGSFPPVAAVAYLGPGVVLVKSDRAMLDNQNIEQYQNKDWAKAVFTELAAAHETAVERDNSILGLRSRITELDAFMDKSAEKIKKYEADLTAAYGKTKDLEASLQEAKKNNEDLSSQLQAAQDERDALNRSLSRYRDPDVQKTVAVIAGAILIAAFFLGFATGRWSSRSKS